MSVTIGCLGGDQRTVGYAWVSMVRTNGDVDYWTTDGDDEDDHHHHQRRRSRATDKVGNMQLAFAGGHVELTC